LRERSGSCFVQTPVQLPAPLSREKPLPPKRTRTVLGDVVHVTPALQARARLLAHQLERDIAGALRRLGTEAMHAYLHARLANPPSAAQSASLVNQILVVLRLRTFAQRRLHPLLVNHGARVMADTQRTLQVEIGLELKIGEQDAQAIMGAAGKDFRAPDIEPQVRAAIMAAIRDGFAAGEHPVKTARRIQAYVPAGRFVHAGPAYRAKLISRTETLNLQRASTLAAYESNASILSVQIRDGLLSDSDDACIERDGRIVPIGEAGAVQPLHPMCTLSFSPVVSRETRIVVPDIPPSLERVPALA